MATVYMATDNRLHRTVAIKAMHPHLAEDPDFRTRFEQEARNAARLTHPNLVSVLDQGEERGTVYLVMEYLPGITLRELLKQQRFLTTEQTLEVSKAVLAGLAAAHESGIIHRDLKPENVLLADDGRIKLADFGLARPASANTGTGQALLGTIAYLSPELVTRGTADKQSDVYAFGIMMFEMLTGQQPFTGEQPMQIAYQHAHDEIPKPSTLSSQSTPALDELVLWATSKDPQERPADAAELLQAVHESADSSEQEQATRVLGTQVLTTQLPRTTRLEPLPPQSLAPVGEAPQRSSPPSPPRSAAATVATTERKRRRKGLILFLSTILIAALAGGAGWWFGHGPGSLITIPDLTELETEVAAAELDALSLTTTLSDCTHLSIEPGHVVETDPATGVRVERESTVDLCVSTGPAILPTPDNLIGLDLELARDEVHASGFEFGQVQAEQFSEEPAGVVLAVLTPEGDPLPPELPEMSRIDFIVSAGPVPEISEMSIEEATSQLENAGLVVDESIGWGEHHDSIPEGDVIYVYYPAETVHRGDTVGLVISLGPELFEIPSVDGLSVTEAIAKINSAGFSAIPPWYLVPAAYDAMTVSSTNPVAGTLVPAGTEIELRIF